MAEEKKSVPLANFRKDLVIYPGPPELNGTPTYVLFDPIKGQYYRISWAHALVMAVFEQGMKLEDLVAAVNARSSLKTSTEEITEILNEAFLLNLLDIPKSSEDIQKLADKGKSSWVWWILMHYLYIRIPLANPDRFLERTLPYVRPLISKTALAVYLFLIITGLLIVFLNFEKYIHTFTYFFSLQGLLAYGIAISGVKVLHELSHAYTAKSYKIHVPTMGIAFMVLWPVLYTNVTNAWRLKNRIDRLAITIAGVVLELVLAGLSTLGWALTEPGLLNSMFFIVSSTTWVTSLIMNINPAMRFDGYYLLTDILGVDNLQSRAFETTRWQLRKWLLGLNMPPPEEDLSPSLIKLMMVYSIYTWIYRIILYTAIALFVYYEFTKVLGIILFILEVIVFILAPFISEARQLALRKQFLHWNIRSVITTTLFALALMWFVFPFPHLHYFTAITIPIDEQDIYIQESAIVEDVFAKRGDIVQKGQTLLTLDSDQINKSRQSIEKEIELLNRQIIVMQIHEEGRPLLPSKMAELQRKETELAAIKEKEYHLTIISHVDGELFQWLDYLKPGLYLGKGTLIGKIADLSHAKILAYVPEDEIAGVTIGEKVTFKLYNPVHEFTGTVTEIYRSPPRYLQYDILASTHGGHLPVHPTKTATGEPRLEFLKRYYEVEISLDNTDYPLRFGKQGVAEVPGPWESKLGYYIRKAKGVIWRESGF